MDVIDKQVKTVENEISSNFLGSLRECLINFESEFEVKKRAFPEKYFDLIKCLKSYSTFTPDFTPLVELHGTKFEVKYNDFLITQLGQIINKKKYSHINFDLNNTIKIKLLKTHCDEYLRDEYHFDVEIKNDSFLNKYQ